MSTAHTVELPGWTPHVGAELYIRPPEPEHENPVLRDRLSIAVYSGAGSISLRPTRAEARRIVAALQAAIGDPDPLGDALNSGDGSYRP